LLEVFFLVLDDLVEVEVDVDEDELAA